MADNDSVRQRIISSVFSKRNAAGNLEEHYVSHVKIWEDAPEGGGMKPRYILVSRTSDGFGFIHKSKVNANGTFSVGKTWKLEELRSVQIVNPLAFKITLSRSYKWQTENQRDQYAFIVALVRLFRTVTGGRAPLTLEGLDAPPALPSDGVRRDILQPEPSVAPPATAQSGRQGVESQYLPEERSSTPSVMRSPSSRFQNPRSQTPSQADPDPRPPSLSQLRNGRPASPAESSQSGRSRISGRGRSQTPTQPLPPSTSSMLSRPRPSIANSTAAIPSITLPPASSSPREDPTYPSRDSDVAMDLLPSSVVAAETPRSRLKITSFPASASSASSPASNFPPPLSTASRSHSPTPSQSSSVRKLPSFGEQRRAPDRNVRISFFDQANQATVQQLINNRGTEAGEEESVAVIMASVEEMLEGYEAASDDIAKGKARNGPGGAADLIEATLLNELMALDKANIHSFLVADNRIAVVCKFLDEAIAELDNMDSLVSSYKIHLNAASDDISYIQSQNRGLQVQTQNQRALLNELENLLQTVHVDREALAMLTQESLEKTGSIQKLEDAAAELYKALQAGRDTDMAATMERLVEYRTHNAQFCKRMLDFLSIMFTAQSRILLGDGDGLKVISGLPNVLPHRDMETYLGRYSGLMLYLREMDENVYAKLCAAYFSSASDLHNKQVNALFAAYASLIKKEDEDQGFSLAAGPPGNRSATGVRRAGTLVKTPTDSRKERDKPSEGVLPAPEAFSSVLGQIASLINGEDEFVTQFLSVYDSTYTFADHMRLESYFRRQAARGAVLSASTTKLVRGAMDLIFGFLPANLKTWLDNAVGKDSLEIVGLIVTLERFLLGADERGNSFLQTVLEKQHTRLKGLFERHVAEQINYVEQTKLTSKKRQGVAYFIKYFPIYMTRVENQLIGAEGLEIRVSVDGALDRIVKAMFDSLKRMAKMDGEGEDKGQLNYHVILIENMHVFAAEMSRMEVGSISGFLRDAQIIHEENMNAYIKIVLRRPFAKIIDFFEGVEQLLKTTAPTEVSKNSNFNKSTLKKVVKEFNAKDVRKHVDGLYKRVEKHFIDVSEKTATDEVSDIAPGTVVAGVWKACEEELLRITELFNKRISQCYSDSGVSLEYSASDVEAAFRRHR